MYRFADLDRPTRYLMADEHKRDLANGSMYVSPLLSDEGQEFYPSLLMDAILNFDEEWLAEQLLSDDWIRPSESLGAGDAAAEVTSRQVWIFARQEFNRLYARAVCRRAADMGVDYVEVYWAETPLNGTSDAGRKVGKQFDARIFLERLRRTTSLEEAIGLSGGPGSGLSVRLPQAA